MTRVAHGCCSGRLADITVIRDDAAKRGWHTGVARHSRATASIQNRQVCRTRVAGTGHRT